MTEIREQEKKQHYFGATFATWAVAETLEECKKVLEAEHRKDWNGIMATALYYQVPTSIEAEYEIICYIPYVQGTKLVATIHGDNTEVIN